MKKGSAQHVHIGMGDERYCGNILMCFELIGEQDEAEQCKWVGMQYVRMCVL